MRRSLHVAQRAQAFEFFRRDRVRRRIRARVLRAPGGDLRLQLARALGLVARETPALAGISRKVEELECSFLRAEDQLPVAASHPVLLSRDRRARVEAVLGRSTPTLISAIPRAAFGEKLHDDPARAPFVFPLPTGTRARWRSMGTPASSACVASVSRSGSILSMASASGSAEDVPNAVGSANHAASGQRATGAPRRAAAAASAAATGVAPKTAPSSQAAVSAPWAGNHSGFSTRATKSCDARRSPGAHQPMREPILRDADRASVDADLREPLVERVGLRRSWRGAAGPRRKTISERAIGRRPAGRARVRRRCRTRREAAPRAWHTGCRFASADRGIERLWRRCSLAATSDARRRRDEDGQRNKPTRVARGRRNWERAPCTARATGERRARRHPPRHRRGIVGTFSSGGSR